MTCYTRRAHWLHATRHPHTCPPVNIENKYALSPSRSSISPPITRNFAIYIFGRNELVLERYAYQPWRRRSGPIGGTRDRGQNGTFPGNWGKLRAEIGRLKRWINFIWKLRVARVIVFTRKTAFRGIETWTLERREGLSILHWLTSISLFKWPHDEKHTSNRFQLSHPCGNVFIPLNNFQSIPWIVLPIEIRFNNEYIYIYISRKKLLDQFHAWDAN